MKKLYSILAILIIFKSSVFAQVLTQTKIHNDSLAMVKQSMSTIEFCNLAIKSAKQTNKLGLAHIYLIRGSAEYQLKHYTKAVSDYTLSISYYPELGDTYVSRAIAYEKLNESGRVIEDYKSAIPYLNLDNDHKAVLFNNMARAYSRLQQYENSVNADSVAISLSPKFGTAYLTRAEAYGRWGKYQLSINDLNIAAYAFQNNAQLLSTIYEERGNMKRALKQNLEAINDFSFAIKLRPDNKAAYWNRAACYRENGDYQLADEGYTKAIEYFKNDPKSLARLYDDRALMETGLQQYAKAIADESTAIGLNTGLQSVYYNRANAYAQNGDYELSNADFIKAIEVYKDNSPAKAAIYSAIAHNEYFLKQYKQDVDNCTLAITLNKTDWSPYMERGRAYMKLMNKELAINDFKQVLVLDTSKRSADYAFSLYYTGNADKAVEVMKSGLISTNDSYTMMANYYNMACLFFLMNKNEQAYVYLKKCIDGGYPKRYALNDADFDNIRSTDDFISIMGNSNK
ncbi:tetratricopeptide repeat protein [Mucilaginibacter sp.]|uniref:tetratricopeptide repeat protein n=1 Tax=Mucilaginibacter sp. TaxID=1882438 RepID=UPI003D10341A